MHYLMAQAKKAEELCNNLETEDIYDKPYPNEKKYKRRYPVTKIASELVKPELVKPELKIIFKPHLWEKV